MEDVWGDGSSGDEREGLDREWRARREEHWSSGYREGLEAGKHETVQQGFNEGYAQGATAGYECGVARGGAATLRALADRLPAGMAQRLQQQGGLQQGGIGTVPYQQLQRQVCEGLAAAAATSPPPAEQEGQQAAEAGQQAAVLQQQPLPQAVRATLEASASELEQLGLHALQSSPHNV